MIKKSKLVTIMVLCIILIFLLIPIANAASDIAAAFGTTYDGLNTTTDMNDAKAAYITAGYGSVRGLMDPAGITLYSNLRSADVQFFASHGSTNNVQFRDCGIIVGNNYENAGRYFYGTNQLDWSIPGTTLVTYASCNSSGANGVYTTNSIASTTAQKGANVVLGFRDKIFTGSATSWARRYNNKLAEGYGVWDAAEYANSFLYVDSNVKLWTIHHHGNLNVTIGKYRAKSSSNNIVDNRNIIQNVKSSIDNSSYDIFKEIEKSYVNFSKENYEIMEPVSGISVNVNTEEIVEGNTYIDLVFKIGDFYTEAGYVIVVKDGTVKAIYDNNIDIAKQEKVLAQKESFQVNLSETEKNSYRIKANEEVKKQYQGKNVTIKEELEKEDISYYYDIITGKKYVCIKVLSEVTNGGFSGIAYDSIKYELK